MRERKKERERKSERGERKKNNKIIKDYFVPIVYLNFVLVPTIFIFGNKTRLIKSPKEQKKKNKKPTRKPES